MIFCAQVSEFPLGCDYKSAPNASVLTLQTASDKDFDKCLFLRKIGYLMLGETGLENDMGGFLFDYAPYNAAESL